MCIYTHDKYILMYTYNQAQTVKNLPTIWETWVQSLGWGGPLEEEMATHSSILAWRNPIYTGAWQATVCGVAENRTRLSD